MPAYYLDTSALAKRYIVEVGSAWVQALVAQQSGQTIYTSVLTQPELVSALRRRVREGLLEAPEAEQLAQQVLEHMTQSYALAAITPSVITQACALLHRLTVSPLLTPVSSRNTLLLQSLPTNTPFWQVNSRRRKD